MKKTLIFVTFLVFLVETNQLGEGSTGIFFQEHDLFLPQGTHNTKRKPISKPDICGDDELLYPGNLDDDWVCDCRPAYVYHPDHDKCYALYRKGPCQENQHLVLKDGSKVPKCEVNACQKDGKVKFNGRCYTLGQRGPCTNLLTADVVDVNETTLEIGCVQTRRLPTQLFTRFTDTLELNGCPKGSKKEARICDTKNVQYWIAPEICGEDKALYKILNEEERLCDCKTGFIYHPDKNMCYQAHLRGSCDEGQIFVLENDAGVCIEGKCQGPNEVMYNEKCVEINTAATCTNGAVIGINAETYDIDCVAPLEDSKPGTVIPDLPNCPKGNKRDMTNKC